MIFTKTHFPDVVTIEPKVLQDTRGFFLESYRHDFFSQNGISDVFLQDNHSQSSKGVLRGLHFQIEPRAHSKLVRVLRGKIYDVIVDLRENSPTFKKWIGLWLSAEDKKMLYIPKGFAHGFVSAENNTDVLYKISDFYSPEHERGILWNDPEINIEWPKIDAAYQVSEKDKKNPTLAQFLQTHSSFLR
jgi:dTDP-4-dehydrorhamnose 3,5-epimerase